MLRSSKLLLLFWLFFIFWQTTDDELNELLDALFVLAKAQLSKLFSWNIKFVSRTFDFVFSRSFHKLSAVTSSTHRDIVGSFWFRFYFRVKIKAHFKKVLSAQFRASQRCFIVSHLEGKKKQKENILIQGGWEKWDKKGGNARRGHVKARHIENACSWETQRPWPERLANFVYFFGRMIIGLGGNWIVVKLVRHVALHVKPCELLAVCNSTVSVWSASELGKG